MMDLFKISCLRKKICTLSKQNANLNDTNVKLTKEQKKMAVAQSASLKTQSDLRDRLQQAESNLLPNIIIKNVSATPPIAVGGNQTTVTVEFTLPSGVKLIEEQAMFLYKQSSENAVGGKMNPAGYITRSEVDADSKVKIGLAFEPNITQAFAQQKVNLGIVFKTTKGDVFRSAQVSIQ